MLTLGSLAGTCAEEAAEQSRRYREVGAPRHSGSDSWWEWQGYADVLADALKRIRTHRQRVERQDVLIAKHRAQESR
jgi:hypothetical protein